MKSWKKTAATDLSVFPVSEGCALGIQETQTRGLLQGKRGPPTGTVALLLPLDTWAPWKKSFTSSGLDCPN